MMYAKMTSIPRRLAAGLLLTAVSASAEVAWRDAPDYVKLFAPVNRQASYSAAVSSDPLTSVLAEVSEDAASVRAPGSWHAQSESATDTFGTAGPYNRWMLARLYGSRPAQVARGARTDRGRVVESWTLISPYPSPDLRTLQPGTLRLVLRIAR
jgi:hypothetical protein